MSSQSALTVSSLHTIGKMQHLSVTSKEVLVTEQTQNPSSDHMHCLLRRCSTKRVWNAQLQLRARQAFARFITHSVHFVSLYNLIIVKLSAHDRAHHPLQQLSTEG